MPERLQDGFMLSSVGPIEWEKSEGNGAERWEEVPANGLYCLPLDDLASTEVRYVTIVALSDGAIENFAEVASDARICGAS